MGRGLSYPASSCSVLPIESRLLRLFLAKAQQDRTKLKGEAMKTTIKIEVKPWKRMGVERKRGGSGTHADKRTKRQRTRSAKFQKILQDYS